MGEQPIIDTSSIAMLNELNPGDNGEFVREIVGIYIEDTPKRLAELKQSLAAGDLLLFVRAAHTIKGSSANVGAAVLRSAAERLEFVARRDGLGGVGPMIAECEAEFARAAAELRRITA